MLAQGADLTVLIKGHFTHAEERAIRPSSFANFGVAVADIDLCKLATAVVRDFGGFTHLGDTSRRYGSEGGEKETAIKINVASRRVYFILYHWCCSRPNLEELCCCL